MEKSIYIYVLYAFFFLLFIGKNVQADTIILKNGKKIEGRIVKEDDNAITVQTLTMSIVLSRDNVSEIKKEENLGRNEVLGDIAFEDNRYREALELYYLAMNNAQDKERIREKIEKIRQIQQEEVMRRFGNELKMLDDMIESKQLNPVETRLKEILEDLPDKSMAEPVNRKLAEVYYLMALEYQNTVNDRMALEYLKKAIDTWPHHYKSHLSYANFLIRNSRSVNEAIDHYLKGLEEAGDDLSKKDRASYHRKLAELYENRKQMKESIEHYKKVMELSPVSYPDTKEKIVNAYLEWAMDQSVTSFDERERLLKEAIIIDEYALAPRFALAYIYYESGKTEKTLQECRKIIEFDPSAPDVHYYMAMCYLYKNEFEKAKKALEKELDINPQNYEALCAMGDYMITGGNYDKAIEYYQRARNLRSEKYRAYIGLARSWRKKEQPKKARENLEQVFLTNPDHIEATILSGSLYKDDNEFKKARELFDEVVSRLKSRNNLSLSEKQLLIEALNQRGELNLLLDSPRLAITDFEESLAIAPENAETYYLIAKTMTKLKNFDQAENYYFRAQELNPENPDYFLGLAILYHQYTQETSKAVKNYTTYIQKGGEDFQTVNEWIRELGGDPVSPPVE